MRAGRFLPTMLPCGSDKAGAHSVEAKPGPTPGMVTTFIKSQSNLDLCLARREVRKVSTEILFFTNNIINKTMSNELTIIKSENVNMIIADTPKVYNENVLSNDKCNAFGKSLLNQIAQQGMNDELDQQAAAFIEKARKTVKKMNEKRSPLTKLFDNIRTEFTSLENDIDPTKTGTVAYKLQQQRNTYAAAKRAEEERRRAEMLRQQQMAQARQQYRLDCEEAIRRAANEIAADVLNKIKAIYNATTLDNYSESYDKLKKLVAQINLANLRPVVPFNAMLGKGECTHIWGDVQNSCIGDIAEQIAEQIVSFRQEYLDRMPSRRQQLEAMAKANAEEAERIRREMAERDAAEKARQAQEQAEREQRERAAAEMRRATTEVGNLFDQQATAEVATYQPKTSVKKKITVLNPEGFAEVISMWWSKEGRTLSVEDLTKVCKKMLTFCEKLANDKTNPQFIQSEHVCYEDVVKAK